MAHVVVFRCGASSSQQVGLYANRLHWPIKEQNKAQGCNIGNVVGLQLLGNGGRGFSGLVALRARAIIFWVLWLFGPAHSL